MKTIALILPLFFFASWTQADERLLDSAMHHLRRGAREWTEFPDRPQAEILELKFAARKNSAEGLLRIRQQDVKQTWSVTLNGKQLGKLTIDENDMFIYLPVPPNGLIDGENILKVAQPGEGKIVSDDVRVGKIALFDSPRKSVLNESNLTVAVVDAADGQETPCRITVLTDEGVLQTVGAESNDQLAVRAGVIYSANGQARFGLPAGKYRILAGRGFEYSLAEVEVTLGAGASESRKLEIRRQVPTENYVACDTHVHTLTHSGHGDATIEERMITLAGEGIEFPIATDHNVQIDYEPIAVRLGVRKYFTPVTGNEVTTGVGHFNVFPLSTKTGSPNFKLKHWSEIFDDIERIPGRKAVILNHARDLHSGTRPFGPKLHNAVVGENLEGWPLRFNAMEVVNSGATQTDALRLFHDWMGLLNRGLNVTPVGSSDSHDVARHFVGQGRTYIRCDDKNPAQISAEEAIENFIQGRVMVSYGLLAELSVHSKSSGEMVSLGPEKKVQVHLRVLAPDWITADRIVLYSNGQPVHEIAIEADQMDQLPMGVKWSGSVELQRPTHDVHLVAIALGPGIQGSHWKTAKAYQPTSPDWKAHVIGCSGAVWLDADGDGAKSSAYDYARKVFAESNGDLQRLVKLLEGFDQAVAAQAAHLYQSDKKDLLSDDAQGIVARSSPAVRTGFQAYLEAWRENEREKM